MIRKGKNNTYYADCEICNQEYIVSSQLKTDFYICPFCSNYLKNKKRKRVKVKSGR